MNILLVSLDNSKEVKFGGKHIHQELLEIAWNKRGYHVTTVYPENNSIPFTIFRFKNKIFRALKLKNKADLFVESIEFKIKELSQKIKLLLNTRKYDYISVQDVVSAIAVKRVLDQLNKDIPVILTLHGYFAREALNYGYFEEREKEEVYKFAYSMEKKATDVVSGIITVDTRIKQYVLEEFNFRKPITVIYNAIDDRRFKPVSNKEKEQLRDYLGIRKDKKILLVARRLVKKNGVIYALKAINELIQKGQKDIFLCIVGAGPEFENLKNFVEQNNLEEYVKFFGSISHSEVDKFYKSADIVLMPSTKSDDVEEATSLSMLEGMACGKVVIASAIGGLKEVIRNGINGILVEDKNYKGISDRINELIENNDLYQIIASNAFRYAQEKHGFISHANAILEFYTQCVNTN
jgi:glycosyltransferase involved in cell wall biosynthesis